MKKRSEKEKTFAQQVDAALNGKLPIYTSIKVCDTPQILLDVGLKQLPMLYTQSHLRKAILPKNRKTHTHGLMVEQIKRLPELLSSPVMIMDSISRKDSIVLVLSETDKEKDPIVATIRPNGIGIYDVDVINSNFITSVYGREDFPKFFEKSLQADNVLYCNKEKAKNLFSFLGLEFPKSFNSVLDLDNIIRQSRNIINTFDEKFLPNEKGTKEMEQTNENEKNFTFQVSEDGTLAITGFAEDVNVADIENLVIPSEMDGRAVTSIGDYAFFDCESLTSIEIPDSVTSIGNSVFNGCTCLTSIEVDENNKYYSSEDGVLFNKDKTELIACPTGKSGSYIIPDSVTIIEDDAFWYCENLTSITIPDSVTSIGFRAFECCTNLTSITIGNNTTNIEAYAFHQCDSLTSIEIPDNVTSIGEGVFENCKSLTNIEVDENNKYYSSEDGVLFNKDKTELIACPTGKSGSYTIPDSVTNIGDYAFFDCPSLTSIEIPDSVTSIGTKAFYFCDNLRSMTIGSGVTNLGGSIFSDCKNLRSVTITDGVKEIGDGAFLYCNSLKSIEIPDSVKIIGYWAFDDTSLEKIVGTPGSKAERYARKHSITFEAKTKPKVRQQEKPPEKRNPWSIKTQQQNAKKISESYEQSKSIKTKEHKKSENEL